MASPKGSTNDWNSNYGSEPPGSDSLYLPWENQEQLLERARDLPAPENVIGPLQTGAWGIIAASPGVGKSMFVNALLRTISGKWGRLGPWRRDRRRISLLIDAEMTTHDLADRYAGNGMEDYFGVCYMDLLDRHEMSPFSLGSEFWQQLLMHAGDFDVIVIDNIEYTLEPAMGHNIWAPETWAQVEPLTRWAKAKNKLLIFVDHLNKEGGVQGSLAKQRGASFVIHLESDYVKGADLAFKSHIKKLRYLVDQDLKRDVLWYYQDGDWTGEVQQYPHELALELLISGKPVKEVVAETGLKKTRVYDIRSKNKHLLP